MISSTEKEADQILKRAYDFLYKELGKHNEYHPYEDRHSYIWNTPEGNIILNQTYKAGVCAVQIFLTSSIISQQKEECARIYEEAKVPTKIFTPQKTPVTNFDSLTEAETKRWLWLRAIEWNNFPTFISQPILPIMLIFFPWYKAIASVIFLDILWSWIRYSYVNATISDIGSIFVIFTKWPASIGSAIYLFLHKHPILAIVALLWPFVSGFICVPGKIGIIELALAKN